jgi:hypothetical protein
MHDVEGGLLGGHMSTQVKHKPILFSQACSSPLKLCLAAGQTDIHEDRQPITTQSVRYHKLPPSGCYMSATSQLGYMARVGSNV